MCVNFKVLGKCQIFCWNSFVNNSKFTNDSKISKIMKIQTHKIQPLYSIITQVEEAQNIQGYKSREGQFYRLQTLRFIPSRDTVPRVQIHLPFHTVCSIDMGHMAYSELNDHDCHVWFPVCSVLLKHSDIGHSSVLQCTCHICDCWLSCGVVDSSRLCNGGHTSCL